MTDEQIALARRAVACRGFRWLPGMLAVRVEEPPFVSEGFDAAKLLNRTYRVLHITERGMVHCYAEAFRAASTAYAPDLTDPATLGCLVALVREAWGPDLRVFRDGVWFVEFAPSKVPEDMYGQRTFTAHTLVDALVDALEAAP